MRCTMRIGRGKTIGNKLRTEHKTIKEVRKYKKSKKKNWKLLRRPYIVVLK